MTEILITNDSLSVEFLFNKLSHGSCCGAVEWFAGVVRDNNGGKPVKGIEYECYEKMAQFELEKIMGEAKKSWCVHRIFLAHRIGLVNAGETSLLVGVTSPHRREAFDATQYMIDQIKKRVPIWKKEIYETGEKKWI